MLGNLLSENPAITLRQRNAGADHEAFGDPGGGGKRDDETNPAQRSVQGRCFISFGVAIDQITMNGQNDGQEVGADPEYREKEISQPGTEGSCRVVNFRSGIGRMSPTRIVHVETHERYKKQHGDREINEQGGFSQSTEQRCAKFPTYRELPVEVSQPCPQFIRARQCSDLGAGERIALKSIRYFALAGE